MSPKRKKERRPWKLSARERRGVLLLIPLLAVLAWILYSAAGPRHDSAAEAIGNELAGDKAGAEAGRTAKFAGDGASDSSLGNHGGSDSGNNNYGSAPSNTQFAPAAFDPNTVTYEELRAMGLESDIAASLVRWRTYGKVFNIPEDFALVRGMTDSIYSVFKPYIKIDSKYKIKPRRGGANSNQNSYIRQETTYDGNRDATGARHATTAISHDATSATNFNADYAATGINVSGSTTSAATVQYDRSATGLVPFDPNEFSAEDFVGLGFSARQAAVIINFRESIGGFRSAEDFARSYVVSPEMFERLKDYIVIPQAQSNENGGFGNGQVTAGGNSRGYGKGNGGTASAGKTSMTELNGADSLALVAIRGIGARSASEIMLYRERLGGFCDIAQLRELRIINEENYRLISQQIWVDIGAIQKIDINFAPPEEVGRHPYITDRTLRRIFKQRQTKGGWRTIEEMTEDNTLTRGEAEKLSPYLQFGPLQP